MRAQICINIFGWVMFQHHVGVLLLHLALGRHGPLCHVALVDLGAVRPQGTLLLTVGPPALPVKVFVVLDRLATEVAHLRAAIAGHFVTAVRFEEGLVALPALADEGLRHLVLDVGPLPHLGVLLHLVTAEGNV